MNIKINEKIKDIVHLIPDNAVLFGGVIRDTINNKDNINNIELLFSSEQDIKDFIFSLIITTSDIDYEYESRISKNYFNKKVNITRIKIYYEPDGYEYTKDITFDCVYPNNPEDPFFIDYDVNSLFGYLSKDKESINIVNSFIKNHNLSSIEDKNVNQVIESICDAIKNELASSYMVEEDFWRKKNIEDHGYETFSIEECNRLAPTEKDFFSTNSVFEQVSAHKQVDKSFPVEVKKESNISNQAIESLEVHKMNIKINEKIKDIVHLIPDNAVLFGYVIQDIIDNKEMINNIDLLFSSEKEIHEFISSIDKNKILCFNIEESSIYNNLNVITVENYSFYNETEYNVVNFNCYCKNQEKSFLKKSLFESIAYISKDKESINILNYYNNSTEENFFSIDSVFEQVNAHKSSNKEKNMSNNKHLDFFTNNLVEGAYAGVASQVVEKLGDSIIFAMKKGGIDECSIMIVESYMKTQIGKAILSMLVGAGIHFVPEGLFNNNNHLQKVADKCVQNAGSEGIQAAFNLAMTFVVPALMGAISDNPQLKALESLEGGKFRVPLPEDKPSVIEDEIPDLTKFATNKKANVG